MSFTMKRNNYQQELMRVSAEELAAWLPGACGVELPSSDPEEIFAALSDGIALCRLVERASPASHWPAGAKEPEPDVRCPYDPKATPGSFKARDNVAKFLEGCKRLGLKPAQLFTTEDLISRRNPRAVINTLLDLARVGASNGLAPPHMIQMERDLAALQANDSEENLAEAASAPSAAPSEEPAAPADAPAPAGEESASAPAPAPAPAPAAEAPAPAAEAPAPAPAPAPVPAEQEEQPAVRPRGGAGKFQFEHLPYVPKAGNEVDEALAEIVNSHQLDVRIHRIALTSEGKTTDFAYRFGLGAQRKVHLRLLRGLLLVRVGQNWEDVVAFITKILAAQYAQGQ